MAEAQSSGVALTPDGSTTPEQMPTAPKVGRGNALNSDAPIQAQSSGVFTPEGVLQEERRLREDVVAALLARARFALDDIVYKPARTIRPTATTQGLELPPGMEDKDSFLDFFLHETEKLHSMMRYFAAPEHQPFTRKLCEPVFPLPKRPEVLRSNTINITARIKNVYLARIVTAMCRTDVDNDGEYGAVVQSDIDALRAISTFVHHAKFASELLFSHNTEELSELIKHGNAEGLLNRIQRDGEGVKRELAIVREKVQAYGGTGSPKCADTEGRNLADAVATVFSEYVLPLKHQVQVAYLLERLDGLKVSFLGPAGTYSQRAALTYFNADCTDGQRRWVPCRGVADVLTAVVANEAAYAIVPIENSQTGIASATRDLLVQGALNVMGEIYIPVKHHLVTACESLSQVTKIYSHAQGFDQCDKWLTVNCPNIHRVAVNSTAKGAMMAAAEQSSSAAICSDLASTASGLPILHVRPRIAVTAIIHAHVCKANIMDSASNATRFLVLGRGRSPRSGADNTLLNILINHEPGALARTLTILAKHGVNLSAIESFPDRDSPRRCYVWTEVNCHIDDEPLQTAMSELKSCTNSIHVLGSFARDNTRDASMRTRTLIAREHLPAVEGGDGGGYDDSAEAANAVLNGTVDGAGPANGATNRGALDLSSMAAAQGAAAEGVEPGSKRPKRA